MKTLAQVEPRTLISTLPCTITNAGSFYLAANLTGSPGQSGIIIQVDNVTVDLNGFTLLGAAGSGAGIAVNTNLQNIVLINGVLRGWGLAGVAALGATGVRAEHLLATRNAGAGLAVGLNSVVADCLVTANGSDGIVVDSQCFVQNNACSTNGTSAMDAGIHALGTGNRIDGNHLTANTGRGIRVDAGANLIIRNNAAFNTFTDYDIAPGSSYGQLVVAPGAGFANASAWANFSSACPPGQTFCGDGICKALATDVNNCGTCGTICLTPNATAGCTAGACVIASCNSGFADCDRNPGNGCEINLQIDQNNCGGCNVVCPVRPNSTPGCFSGTCVIAACNAGFADCNSNPSDGCETRIASDLNNCGACGKHCVTPNGTPACTSGLCVTAACNAGFADCNGNPTDGCEISVATDVRNCGTCSRACVTPNGTPACAAGACVIASCNSGFADCNGNFADGCETQTTTDPNNCGTCGKRCTTPNGTPACTSGLCVTAACNAGFADCNGNALDGCEVNINTDSNNCGRCGTVCATTSACAGGICKLKAGQVCTVGSQCASGVCTSGRCG